MEIGTLVYSPIHGHGAVTYIGLSVVEATFADGRTVDLRMTEYSLVQ